MNKYIDVSAKTEDDAIAKALKELGMERDEVSVEVIERAKPGFLGIGGSPALVRVTYQFEESKTEKIENFLSGLFQQMGVEASAEIEEKEDNIIEVKLSGQNMGALIGKRGETLDAIQHLVNSVVNKGVASGRVRVNIDAENYRAKRVEALEKLAVKIADKAVKYHRNVTLEPMNSYERHIIHTALQDYEGVTTYSTGVEPNRRIVVAYDRSRGKTSTESREWK